MQTLLDLLQHGQSYWLDNLTRGMIRSGELQRRVEEQGLRGVTSNPAIFHKAISSGSDYDEQIQDLADRGESVEAMYESLVVTDIREACDVLRTVYDDSGGVDGYVSLEVSPYLIHDTAGSLEEARHLWEVVDRPNLMIKIPGTPAGVPAIEELLYEGINVNVTLLFAVEAYESVARAYIRALERRARDGRALDSVASVASFFLSRIDVLVDGLLAQRVGALDSLPAPQSLYGRAAVASARMAYRSYGHLVAGDDWRALAQTGAKPQRLLWASTSTKNPLYDPVRYVEPLVGRDTVNTMPEVTIDAFASDGCIAPDAIERGVEEAERVFSDLEASGIHMSVVNEQLLAEGAQKFLDPFDALLSGLARRRAEMRTELRVQASGPAEPPPALGPLLAALHGQRFAARLADRDPTLWPGDEELHESIAGRLGWTRGADAARSILPDLIAFAEELRDGGVTDVVLLGMGGSSLCPLVAKRMLRAREGYPRLTVLDDVDPAAVSRVDRAIDPLHTVFVVASKSGGTIETLTLYRYFFGRLEREDVPAPGRHFVAVTDAGSPLIEEAERLGFRRVFEAPPDVGGRYSAMTVFGLLPMALMGADVARVVEWARQLEHECSATLPESSNPAVRLGATLGILARSGRDKLVLTASRGATAFPLWVEQLVAESTGKLGTGILPVTDEPLPSPGECGADRVFVHYSLAGDDDGPVLASLNVLEESGHPVIRFRLPEAEALGGEFLRWELATATAGLILGVNPFDEPDVSAAKLATAELLDQRAGGGDLPDPVPHAAQEGIDLFADGYVPIAPGSSLREILTRWLADPDPGGYVAILGFFEPTPERAAAVRRLRERLRARTGLATTFGYGPRYLHSTGQFHKGGPTGGRYLVLTADPVEDVEVPKSESSLGTLQRAQALGDVRTLRERGRPVLHAHLGWYVEKGLDSLADEVGTVDPGR
jgi:transaldolase/glucose-6-phosphate isomerase